MTKDIRALPSRHRLTWLVGWWGGVEGVLTALKQRLKQPPVLS